MNALYPLVLVLVQAEPSQSLWHTVVTSLPTDAASLFTLGLAAAGILAVVVAGRPGGGRGRPSGGGTPSTP